MQLLIIVVGIVLIAVGLLFAVVGLGGEPGTGGWRRVGIQGPAWLILVAIGVMLLLFAAGRDWSDAEGGRAEQTTTTANSLPETTSSTQDSSAAGSVLTSSTEQQFADGECRITIENPFASIREEPDPFGQEIIRIPEGTYVVEEVSVESFAGQNQRWFFITADGRSGWIEDSTIWISSKSTSCP